MTDILYNRILGSLAVAGMGDALGASTEQWSIDEIASKFGGLVSSFTTPPDDTFAGAGGGKRAEVTDDASQMYYLARSLVAANGVLDSRRWVACLLDWANTCPKASTLGTNTAAIIEALRAGANTARVGVIGQSGRKMTSVGISNGAAIRIAPIGMVFPGRIYAACEQALVACLPTHDTHVAISAACSIAAAVSQALVSDQLSTVIDAAVIGGQIGERLARAHARAVAGPNYLARLELALQVARSATSDRDFMRRMERLVGNSLLAAESVPAAMGLVVYAKGDPMRTIMIAASMGNDTDSIATMAGAIVGAFTGAASLPRAMFQEFADANAKDFDLPTIAWGLTHIAAMRLPAARTSAVPRQARGDLISHSTCNGDGPAT